MKRLLMIFCYTVRSVPRQTVIREASSGSRQWEQMQRPTLGRDQGILGNWWRNDCWSQRGQGHCPQNQLSRAHRGSQRWKQRSHSLHVSALGPLNIHYDCWLDVLGGLLTVKVGISLIFLPVWGTLFLLLGCLIQP